MKKETDYEKRKAVLTLLVAVTTVAVGGFWLWSWKASLGGARTDSTGTRAAVEAGAAEFRQTLEEFRVRLEALQNKPTAAASSTVIQTLKAKVIEQSNDQGNATTTSR